MGIQGLLPFLQKCTKKVDMSEFSGCTVAVDVYCWLHKGAFSCAEKLARGEDTDQYVQYCMKYVNMLLSHNIRPILVFDGCHLPAKAETEKSRRERRESTKKKACELLRSERIDEARQMLRRCVDITHSMAHKLITRARAANIDCIVAPYEADAQLAYLNMSGIAHFVITEDSDLLLFGCTKVVFKLDIGGAGLLVEQEMLPVAMKMRPEEFTLEKFRQMCVLSGCDYLASLPGIGLTKACKFVKLTSQNDISKILHKIGSYLNMPNLLVPEDYKYKFVNAISMFRHQPAFDPKKRCVVPLTPIEDGADVVLPKAHPPDTALQLALGNIDPISMKVVDDWDPDTKLKEPFKNKSIWSENYRTPKPLPPPRVPKMTPAVKSTFGKRMSMSTDDIIEHTQQNIRNEEEELEEMRQSWGVTKKRRLDLLEAAENDASLDEVVAPSPPRPNPFKAGSQTNSGNVPLTNSTTLSRLTSPSSNIAIKSKFSKFSSPSVESKAPLVVSRYFASPIAVKNTSSEATNSSSKTTCLTEEKEKVQPVVVPESPDKPNEISSEVENRQPTKRNIFLVSPSQTSKPKDDEPVCINSLKETNDSKKPKSLLSVMEDEDEIDYKNSGSNNIKPCVKSGVSKFKWKPMVESDKAALPKNNIISKPVGEIILDTPPNSQEDVIKTMPKLPSYLEPARSVGLSKNKSAAMQNFLSKFKCPPKSKLKSNH